MGRLVSWDHVLLSFMLGFLPLALVRGWNLLFSLGNWIWSRRPRALDQARRTWLPSSQTSGSYRILDRELMSLRRHSSIHYFCTESGVRAFVGHR